MLKLKLIYSLVIFLISGFMVYLPKASAGDSFLDPYLSFHTVAASGLTEATTTFDLSEKPWLYINRDSEFYVTESDSIKWYSVSHPNGVSIEVELDNIVWNGDHTVAWVAFEDSCWYDTLKNKEGEWTIISKIGDDTNSAETSFTVTPEPVSSVLFLTGGAALFLRRRKKGSRF
jgi:hypothetical protein